MASSGLPIEFIVYFIFIAFFATFFFKLIKTKRIKFEKDDIANAQAKISALRISLKAKIKRKVNTVKAKVIKPVITGDPIDQLLQILLANSFLSSKDFQSYFDISKKLLSYLETDAKSIAEASTKSTEQVSSTAKNQEAEQTQETRDEIIILRLIKEIADLSKKLNEKVRSHNENYPKSPLPLIDPIEFDSLVEIKKMFESNSVDSNP